MHRLLSSILLAATLLVGVLASEESMEVDGPCEQNCCLDCICCGPGTKWDEELDQCVPHQAGPDPISFDWADKCFLPKCVGEACCAEGTELSTDPTRDDDACWCIPSMTSPSGTPTSSPSRPTSASSPSASPTESPSASPTTFNMTVPADTPTSSPTGSPTSSRRPSGPTNSPSPSAPPTESPTSSPTTFNASITALYDGDFCPDCRGECPISQNFTVVVNNTSPPGVTICLDTLNDTLWGDLNGKGDCTLPQEIEDGGSYTCSFEEMPTQGGVTVFELIAEGEGYPAGEGTCGTRRRERHLQVVETPTPLKVKANDFSIKGLVAREFAANEVPPGGCGSTDKTGPVIEDKVVNKLRIDCTGAEYHLLKKEPQDATFKSVGKCPWIEGRNFARYYEAKGSPKKQKFIRTFWISFDGKLPVKVGTFPQEVTPAEYKVGTNADGKFHNDDRVNEGTGEMVMVDVNAYNYCLGNPTADKTLWEMALDGMSQEEIEDNRETFVPDVPACTPDDNPLIPGVPGSCPKSQRRRLQVSPGTITEEMLLNPNATLPEGLNSTGLETPEFNNTFYSVTYEILNAFPLLSSALARGFLMQFDPASESGTGRIFMPLDMVDALGLDSTSPARIAVDNIDQFGARYVVDDFDVFEFEFNANSPFTVAVLYGLP